MATLISDKLLEILACPFDKKELVERAELSKLECSVCHRRYPVVDGIPVMLLEEAELPNTNGEAKDAGIKRQD